MNFNLLAIPLGLFTGFMLAKSCDVSATNKKVEEVKVFEVGKCYSNGEKDKLSYANDTIFYVYTSHDKNAYMVSDKFSTTIEHDLAKYKVEIDCDKERPYLLRDYLFHQLNYKDNSIKEVTEVCMKAEQLKLLRNQKFCDEVKKVYEYHFGV